MRTALLTIAAAATAAVGLAPPASAAAPVTTTYDYAFTTLGAPDGETFFYAEGYDVAEGDVGIVDVFGATLECTLPEGGAPAPFASDGRTAATLVGTLVVDCYDHATGRGGEATVEVDLRWTASGETVRTPLSSPRTGCTGVRYTTPADVTGSVQLRAPSLGLDATAVLSGRPAELAHTVSRCR